MNVNIDMLKALIVDAIDPLCTGDRYADALYQSVIPIVGHPNRYYRLFYRIAEEMNPRFVVELGSWRAIAAAHFATASSMPMVVTIDTHREDKIAQDICREVTRHYPNVQYINKRTFDAVDDVKQLGIPIDILFIDAYHEYPVVKHEWKLYEPLLSEEALIICDDIRDAVGATVDMVKFWNELDYEKFLDIDMHDGIPMGFMRYTR